MSSSSIVFDTSFNGGVILPIITITYSGTDIIKFTKDQTFTMTSGIYSQKSWVDGGCDSPRVKNTYDCPNDGNNNLFINFISLTSSQTDSCGYPPYTVPGYNCTFSCIGLDIDHT